MGQALWSRSLLGSLVEERTGLPNVDESPTNNARVFVVDDDADTRNLLMAWLEGDGISSSGFDSGPALLAALENDQPDGVCLDVRMPGMDGIEVLRRLKERGNRSPVVMLTADEQLETAVECMKLGAFDYQVKPLLREATIGVMRAAIRENALDVPATVAVPSAEVRSARRILGSSGPIRQVMAEIDRVAQSKVSVFVQGENGTGKELVARVIHERSERADKPFVVVNCGAIPESLHESELFGSVEGPEDKGPGKIEMSSGGTLFLDDISELSQGAQVRLLRALQERSVERVGGHDQVPVNLRLISATQHDLARLVDEAKFRHDLFYRLVIYPIDMPPLRDRIEDLHELFPHFLSRYAAEFDCPVSSYDPEVLRRLQAYRWAGNVRELENLAQRMVISARGARITVADLPSDIRDPAQSAAGSSSTSTSGTVRSIEEAEREAIVEALRHVGGNVTEAARRLGIGRATLYRKLTRYEIERSSF